MNREGYKGHRWRLKLIVLLVTLCVILTGCIPIWEQVSEAGYQGELPPYEGIAYAVLNDNQPEFTDKEKQNTKAFETYSRLDFLGRCGVAYANICEELEPTEPRGEIGSVKPSGWQKAKYPELVDGNYLYNRCHLIGYQLAGENANEKNLITGTRYMNVQGMLPFENMVDDYVDETGNHVLYRVTPIFEDRNLVASGVKMEAWSVEDDGTGICFNVYCFNRQPGIAIDYETGDSWESEEEWNTEFAGTGKPVIEILEPQVTYEFVLNTNTKKVHLPECSSVSEIRKKNRKDYKGSLQDIEEQGYEPCKNCVQPLLK